MKEKDHFKVFLIEYPRQIIARTSGARMHNRLVLPLYLTRTFQHYSRAYVYTICKNLKNLVLFPSSRIAFVLFTWLDSSFSPLSVSLRRLRGRREGNNIRNPCIDKRREIKRCESCARELEKLFVEYIFC